MKPFPKSARGIKPQYFSDPAADQLLSVVFSLASELSATRDRLDALERVLARDGNLDRDQVSGFRPDEQAAGERQQSRDAFVQRLLHSVEASLDAATREDNPQSSSDIFKHLE